MDRTLLTFFLVSILGIYIAGAQALPADTLWTKSLGGSGTEVAGQAILNNLGMNAASVALDSAGYIYTATYSTSSDGYVGGNAGLSDIWLVKLTPQGDTVWTKRYGGSGDERVYHVRAVSTGGCILVGETQSADGDFSASKGNADAFIIRVDEDGNTVFKKQYGGAEQDYLYDIVETAEGNFVACGESNSGDGDLAGVGEGLAWVLYISGSNGNVTKSLDFTGPDHSSPDFLENFTGIIRLADGSGYLATGFTTPNFNDFSKDNIWVQKFGLSGTGIWSKKYGSVNGGDYSATLLDAGAGEYYVVGTTSAAGGDNTAGYYGGAADGWLLKCDASGTLLWNKHYGGTDWDFFADAVVQPGGTLLITGFTRSANTDLSGTTPYGVTDFWLLQLSDTGAIVDMRRAGGSQADVGIGMAYDAVHNRVVMVGRTESTDKFVHGNNGGRDMWVVCYGSNIATGAENLSFENAGMVYPNPCRDYIVVSSADGVDEISVYDVSGREIMRQLTERTNSTRYVLPTNTLQPGIYFIKAKGEGPCCSHIFIKSE